MSAQNLSHPHGFAQGTAAERRRMNLARAVKLEPARRRSPWQLARSRLGGKTQQREHASLAGALSDLASSWRKRLH